MNKLSLSTNSRKKFDDIRAFRSKLPKVLIPMVRRTFPVLTKAEIVGVDPTRIAYLVKKWGCLLDKPRSDLSTAILIESQETWVP